MSCFSSSGTRQNSFGRYSVSLNQRLRGSDAESPSPPGSASISTEQFWVTGASAHETRPHSGGFRCALPGPREVGCGEGNRLQLRPLHKTKTLSGLTARQSEVDL